MDQDSEKAKLKQRSIFSFLSLSLQSGYSAFLGLAANLVLTILLTPRVFGIYFTTLSIISLLNYFSDIGLAASLIQKKELSEEDVTTTFTVQQTLIITLILLGFAASSFIRGFYQLPQDGIYLFWSLLVSFFLSSLKTIPSVFLERKIQFHKIVIVQVIENTVFYLTVMLLALMNFGLMSFTYAVLLRAIVGVILIYILSPWKPRLGISVASLKKLLSFGIPFQASSFLALFKDDLITLFLGKVVGFEALGYIGWAKKWAESPIRIIMDNIGRVLFPVIARIQHDKEQIARLLDKVLYYQTLLLAPTLTGLALLMHVVVTVIPKYGKWQPALPLFYLFCLSAFFSSYSTPFINLFNALGKVKLSLVFMTLWTVTTWILTPLFTRMYGIYGFPFTQLILSSTFGVVILVAKRQVSFHFFRSTYASLISSVLMGVAIYVVSRIFGPTFVTLMVSVILGSFVYVLNLYVMFHVNLYKEVRILIKK